MEVNWLCVAIWYIIGLFCQYHIIIDDKEVITVGDIAAVVLSAMFGPFVYILLVIVNNSHVIICKRKRDKK